MNAHKFRVLIADDHAMMREGISAGLRLCDDIEVVGEAGDGLEAIEKTRLLMPDVVLMDLSMPKLGGLEATIEIRKIDSGIKVLVLTQYDDREYVSRMLKAGVSGYLLKRAAGSDLVSAIRAVSRGECYLYPAIASEVVAGYLGRMGEIAVEDPYEKLTDREKQVLRLIAEGCTHKEAAAMLGISVKTVITHQTNIGEKTGLGSRAALVRFAVQKGIIARDA